MEFKSLILLPNFSTLYLKEEVKRVNDVWDKERGFILSLSLDGGLLEKKEELNCVELLLLKGKPLGYYCTQMSLLFFL
jgi:hypothetical protein